MKELKSLADFNADRRADIRASEERNGNGIACPRCQSEMFDDDDGQGILCSIPPQKVVRCLCGHMDYRVA